MAVHIFRFNQSDDLIFDEKNVAIPFDYAMLRRQDSDGNYSSVGEYTSDFIVTGDYQAQGIRSMFGFEFFGDLPEGTSVTFQVSVDGGNNFLYWDGSNWSPVLMTTHVNTAEEINDGISSLKFNVGDKKRIRFKCFLNADSTKRKSPILGLIALYTELEFNFFKDVSDSIYDYLSDNYATLLNHKIKSSSTTSSFSLQTDYKPVSVIGAFNNTQDPYSVNNILDSFSISDTLNINTTQPIPSGEKLFIEYKGVPKNIYITFPDDIFQLSETPAIIITPMDAKHHPLWRTDLNQFDREPSLEQYRETKTPVVTDIFVDIDFVSINAMESQQMLDSAFELLDIKNSFKSFASGEEYIVLEYHFMSPNHNIKHEVASQTVTIRVSGRKLQNKFNIHKEVKEVVFSMSDRQSFLEKLDIV